MQDLRRHAFGAMVRSLRRVAHLTQEDLAAHAGLSVYSISNIERGVAHTPRKATLHLLAQALQLDAQQTATLMQAASPDPFAEDVAPAITLMPILWGVPFRRNPFFTGREDILERLHALLHPAQNAGDCQSCALSGLGGIGKTQTAVEYAYRYADDYVAIFWIHAETRETMQASIIASAHLLAIPEHDEHDPDKVMAAFSRWLAQTPGCLLIWDNVESPELVMTLMPATRHGAMLFTSRRQALQMSAHILALQPLTVAEGTRFLLVRSRWCALDDDATTPTQQDATTAREIALRVAGLPLALDQAGAYIEATQCHLDDYLRLFDAAPVRLLAEREPHADHPASVTKTLTLAFTQVQVENGLAAELLIVCAFLAPEEIPEEVFLQGASHLGTTIAACNADPFQFQTALKTLRKYSLIQRHPATRAITIHRLVQIILKDHLTEEATQLWVERIIAAIAAIFPQHDNVDARYWQTCKKLLAHALICLELGDRWQTAAAARITLMNHIAYYFTSLAQFTAAERLHLRALQMSEDALDPMHPLVTSILNKLGRLYKDQGRYADAEALVLRALMLREQMLGPDHTAVASSKNNLALLYYEQGKYAEAESFYRSAWRIWEQAYGNEHQLIAAVMNNLAALYQEQGEYDKAEPLYVRALHIWQQTLGVEHPKIALPLNNIAEIAIKQERYAEAEPLLLQALRLTEQTLGAEHLNVAYLLGNLGDVYRASRRYVEAEAMYQRALLIKEHTFGVSHQQVSILQQKVDELAAVRRHGDSR